MQPGTPGSVTSGGSWAERFILATPVLQGPTAAAPVAVASQPPPANDVAQAALQADPQQPQPLPGLTLVCTATVLVSVTT